MYGTISCLNLNIENSLKLVCFSNENKYPEMKKNKGMWKTYIQLVSGTHNWV